MKTNTSKTEETELTEEQKKQRAEFEALQKRTVKVTASVGELNGIFDILGNAPTSTNVWPVLMRLKEEAEQYLSEEDKKKEEPAASE